MGTVGKIRNPIVVLLLAIITFGIYGIFWYIKSFIELKAFRQNRGFGLGCYIVMYFLLLSIPLWWLLPKDIGDAFNEIGQPKVINGNYGFLCLIPGIGGLIWFFMVVGAYNKLWIAAGQSAPQ